MTEISQRFIQAIDLICEEKGKNVKQLCEELPFSAGYVTNLRKKPQSIGSTFLLALYKKYKISPLWILAGEGEIKIEKPGKRRSERKILEEILLRLDKITEIEGDIIKKMLEAIISVNVLPSDTRKKLAALGSKKSN